MRILNIGLSLTILLATVASVHSEELPKTIGAIERLDPAFDKLVDAGKEIEVLAGGFEWSEGPVWIPTKNHLLFSDIPHNRIVKWDGTATSVFLQPSGYTGRQAFTGGEPGSNGLALDSQGRLVFCQHGDRCISRLEANGMRTILVDNYKGKRLNSPNDLVYMANGDLYFTDPPYGLPERYEDPARELDWCGVYRLTPDGTLTLLTKEMTRPNGIALSPDQKTLYVAQSDPKAAIWKSFPIKADGTLGKSTVIYDATKWVGERPGLPDGLAVDTEGNIWATGPGGVLVMTPGGKLLGRLATGEATANCGFGDDGKTLYITADMYLCKVRTNATGLIVDGPAKK